MPPRTRAAKARDQIKGREIVHHGLNSAGEELVFERLYELANEVYYRQLRRTEAGDLVPYVKDCEDDEEQVQQVELTQKGVGQDEDEGEDDEQVEEDEADDEFLTAAEKRKRGAARRKAAVAKAAAVKAAKASKNTHRRSRKSAVAIQKANNDNVTPGDTPDRRRSMRLQQGPPGSPNDEDGEGASSNGEDDLPVVKARKTGSNDKENVTRTRKAPARTEHESEGQDAGDYPDSAYPRFPINSAFAATPLHLDEMLASSLATAGRCLINFDVATLEEVDGTTAHARQAAEADRDRKGTVRARGTYANGRRALVERHVIFRPSRNEYVELADLASALERHVGRE